MMVTLPELRELASKYFFSVVTKRNVSIQVLIIDYFDLCYACCWLCCEWDYEPLFSFVWRHVI